MLIYCKINVVWPQDKKFKIYSSSKPFPPKYLRNHGQRYYQYSISTKHHSILTNMYVYMYTFKMNLLSILFTLWARRCSHRVLDWTSTTGDFGTLGTGTCPPAPHPLHCTPRPCSNVASPPIQTGSVRITESISLIQQKKKQPQTFLFQSCWNNILGIYFLKMFLAI